MSSPSITMAKAMSSHVVISINASHPTANYHHAYCATFAVAKSYSGNRIAAAMPTTASVTTANRIRLSPLIGPDGRYGKIFYFIPAANWETCFICFIGQSKL